MMTPMCAAPRAPPPESTRQIFGRLAPPATPDAPSALAGGAIAASIVVSSRKTAAMKYTGFNLVLMLSDPKQYSRVKLQYHE
ncbi:MAG: hypothetical protein Q7T25_09965, partial [Sideroxyarcus sp.]|nr:hypothetical protein [Sideroxyarcus sp.]